jgi:hypothetical protein
MAEGLRAGPAAPQPDCGRRQGGRVRFAGEGTSDRCTALGTHLVSVSQSDLPDPSTCTSRCSVGWGVLHSLGGFVAGRSGLDRGDGLGPVE